MPDSNDSLDKLLLQARTRPAAPEPEQGTDPDALTLADMSGPMRPSNKPLTRLHVVLRDGKIRTLQYAFLDVESRFDGDTMTFIFAGTRHLELTVKGRGAEWWRWYDLITLHRLPYLREAVRDFGGDGETVVTEVRIRDITPRGEE